MFDFEGTHVVTIDQEGFKKSLEDRALGYFLAIRNRDTLVDDSIVRRVSAEIDGTPVRLWLHGLGFPYGNELSDGAIEVSTAVGDQHIRFKVLIDSDFDIHAVQGSFEPDPRYK